MALGNSPHWQSRSICQTLEWHGLTIEIIGEENWIPGASAGGIEVHSVTATRDVKGCPCVVDLTELVEHYGTEEIETLLGAPVKPKPHVPVCRRRGCPDRTFADILHSAPQDSAGPVARRIA